MKIAFLTRIDAFDKNGGDTYQISMYKKYFEANGHTALIITELDIPQDCDFYVLVNMDRPLELIAYFHLLKRDGKLSKTLFLTIHHSYKAIDYFEKNVRKGKYRSILRFATTFHEREKIKNIARAIKYKTLFPTLLSHSFINYESKIKEIINEVRSLILIAEGEKNVIENDYDIKVKDFFIVKNGVDVNENINSNFMARDIDVLVCGRIESRKNSLAVANYFKNTTYNVVFVGAINTNDKEYGESFVNVVNSCDNLTYLGRVDSELMPSIYLRSKIHLSASWFEVASLVDLEAYAYGCHVISSIHGHTYSYLGDRAIYLDPCVLNDLDSMLNVFLKKQSNQREQYSFISNNFTWERSQKTFFDALNKMA
ncbi:glycosyltransferase family 4 protein [Klebsiella aerogenes]|uniref:glycosyltransferase family 4 protein n=1 Tax=Klebsiella aerogenes TaxID=548 RepID=UPI00292CCCFF|nr:glycosyltransferase family 4 protein [Klebsiella aerogenes]